MVGLVGPIGDVGPVGDVGGSAETGFEHAAVNDNAARMTIAAPRWTMIHSVTNPGRHRQSASAETECAGRPPDVDDSRPAP